MVYEGLHRVRITQHHTEFDVGGQGPTAITDSEFQEAANLAPELLRRYLSGKDGARSVAWPVVNYGNGPPAANPVRRTRSWCR